MVQRRKTLFTLTVNSGNENRNFVYRHVSPLSAILNNSSVSLFLKHKDEIKFLKQKKSAFAKWIQDNTRIPGRENKSKAKKLYVKIHWVVLYMWQVTILNNWYRKEHKLNWIGREWYHFSCNRSADIRWTSNITKNEKLYVFCLLYYSDNNYSVIVGMHFEATVSTQWVFLVEESVSYFAHAFVAK